MFAYIGGEETFLSELITPTPPPDTQEHSRPKLKFLHIPTFDPTVTNQTLFPILSVTMPQFFGTPSPSK